MLRLPILLALFIPSLITTAGTLTSNLDASRPFQGPLSLESRYFIENIGQWPGSVRFLVAARGANVWITDEGTMFDHYILPRPGEDVLFAPDRKRRMAEFLDTSDARGHRFRMLPQGKTGSRHYGAHGRLELYHNYFIGNDPSRWKANVPLHSEVLVEDVFEGIDQRFYLDSGALRYDFIIQPKADPSLLVFLFDGDVTLGVNGNGELVIGSAVGDILHRDLRAYQFVGGTRRSVECRYQIKGNELRFVVGEYDSDLPLVIDPIVASTYLGGIGSEYETSVAVDPAGSIVVAGHSSSHDFPTTPGAWQLPLANYMGSYVAKLSSDLGSYVFATYFGASTGSTRAWDVTVNQNGNIYLCGEANSLDFPTTPGVVGPVAVSNPESFITAFNSSGTSLVFSTLITGSQHNGLWDLEVDAGSNVYAAGYFAPSSYLKLDPTGSTIVYSGTIANGSIIGLAVSQGGEMVLSGETSSAQFPVTPGAFRTTYSGGSKDGFVLRLDATGGSIAAATYLGGGSSDLAVSVALNSLGRIVVAGLTQSPDFPTSPGSFDPVFNGVGDGFIATFSPDLSTLISSTFFGGSVHDAIQTVGVLPGDRLVVSGNTRSVDLPLTTGAPDATIVDVEGMVAVFDPGCTGLYYSTFLGGSMADHISSHVFHSPTTLVVGGFTESMDFPITPGVVDPMNPGGWDGFITLLQIPGISTSVTQGVNDGLASDIALHTFPNPFNNGTHIRFTLTEPTDLSVSVHTVDGKLIRRIGGGTRSSGMHDVYWDGHGEDGARVPVGFYLFSITGSSSGEASPWRRVLPLMKTN